eukprot:8043640-Pyramimonas_sp.AAC.1
MTQVALPVYEHFFPGCTRGFAAQNSAARLIGGSTFHFMAGLTRRQTLTRKRPSRQPQGKMLLRWNHLVLAMIDEASVADPQLLAVLNARANWGRHDSRRLDPSTLADTTFGNILAQICMGDFM